MKTEFKGFNENCLTFPVTAKFAPGTIVSFGSDGKVKKAGEDDVFFGVVKNGDSEYATIMICGAVELPCDSTVDVGYMGLSVTSTGKLCDGLNNKLRLVLSVDSTAGKAVIIL